MTRAYLDGQPVPRCVSVAKLLLAGAEPVSLVGLEDALDAATAVGAEPFRGYDVADMLRQVAREIERVTERRDEVAEQERREAETEAEAVYLSGELDALIGGTLAAIERIAE